MSPRSAILTTTAILAGLGIATTASANATTALPTAAPNATPIYTVAGTLSPTSFQDSLDRSIAEAVAAGILSQQTSVSAAATAQTDEVAAWASSPKSMAVKFCESTNNYSINTGNGYYGAWQFDHPSWHANGGGAFAEYPHQATPEQQDLVAYTYFQQAGWGPWECG